MRQIISALFFAGLILATALFISFGEQRGFVGDGAERQAGALMGIILMWFGNLLPKQAPSGCATCGAEGATRMHLFAGQMLVAAGLIHALIWVFAPYEHANFWAAASVATALAIVLVRAVIGRSFV